MLQGRLFSYDDAMRNVTVSASANQIPVNLPKRPFHSYRRDGSMRVDNDYFVSYVRSTRRLTVPGSRIAATRPDRNPPRKGDLMWQHEKVEPCNFFIHIVAKMQCCSNNIGCGTGQDE